MVQPQPRPEARASVVGAACEWAAGNPCVVALLLVGSGARGSVDAWSDVDLVAVVDPGTSPADCGEPFLIGLGAVVVTRWQHRPGVDVLCALLRDGTGVDLGVWSTELLFASKPDWVMLYARSDTDREVTLRALHCNVAPARSGSASVGGSDPAWQGALGATVRAGRAGADPIRASDHLDVPDDVRQALRELVTAARQRA